MAVDDEPLSMAKAGEIWHKVIPGVAITLQVSLENLLNWFFSKDTKRGPMHCAGDQETISRTIAFVITALVGLLAMKWDFRQTNRTVLWYHYIINIGLVTAWLLAISDFPLACWIEDDQALNEKQQRSVSLTRFFLVLTTQALASLEIFKDYILPPADNTSSSDMATESTLLL